MQARYYPSSGPVGVREVVGPSGRRGRDYAPMLGCRAKPTRSWGSSVMRKSLSIAAYTLVGLSAVCMAQPPAGVTPEMIASALPEEGAPKAVPGPYAVTPEPAFGSSALRTFR